MAAKKSTSNVDLGGAEAVSDMEGTATLLQQMLISHMSEMKSLTENISKSIQDNYNSMKNVSEQFATKQDVGADEKTSADLAVATGNSVAISNLVNNNAARHADTGATRSQVSFDQLASITNMHIAGQSLNAQLATALHVLDSHQQCASNASKRGMEKA